MTKTTTPFAPFWWRRCWWQNSFKIIKRGSKRKKKRDWRTTHSIPLSSTASITTALCCSPWQCKVTISRWKPIFIRISCIWKRIWGVSCPCAGIHILGSQSCQLTWNLVKQWETFCSPFLHPISYYYWHMSLTEQSIFHGKLTYEADARLQSPHHLLLRTFTVSSSHYLFPNIWFEK